MTQVALASLNGRVFRSTGPPNAGRFIVGDRVDNSAATGGQPVGWVCVKAGSPGEWMPVVVSTAGDTRPPDPVTGAMHFDTDLGQPVWWNGAGWIDANGETP